MAQGKYSYSKMGKTGLRMGKQQWYSVFSVREHLRRGISLDTVTGLEGSGSGLQVWKSHCRGTITSEMWRSVQAFISEARISTCHTEDSTLELLALFPFPTKGSSCSWEGKADLEGFNPLSSDRWLWIQHSSKIQFLSLLTGIPGDKHHQRCCSGCRRKR